MDANEHWKRPRDVANPCSGATRLEFRAPVTPRHPHSRSRVRRGRKRTPVRLQKEAERTGECGERIEHPPIRLENETSECSGSSQPFLIPRVDDAEGGCLEVSSGILGSQRSLMSP